MWKMSTRRRRTWDSDWMTSLCFFFVLLLLLLLLLVPIDSRAEEGGFPRKPPRRALHVAPPPNTLGALQAFARRFWSSLATLTSSDSRLKRDGATAEQDDGAKGKEEISTTSTTTTTTTTTLPPSSSSAGSEAVETPPLASQLVDILTKMEELATVSAPTSTAAEKPAVSSPSIDSNASTTVLLDSVALPLSVLPPEFEAEQEAILAGDGRPTVPCNDTSHNHQHPLEEDSPPEVTTKAAEEGEKTAAARASSKFLIEQFPHALLKSPDVEAQEAIVSGEVQRPAFSTLSGPLAPPHPLPPLAVATERATTTTTTSKPVKPEVVDGDPPLLATQLLALSSSTGSTNDSLVASSLLRTITQAMFLASQNVTDSPSSSSPTAPTSPNETQELPVTSSKRRGGQRRELPQGIKTAAAAVAPPVSVTSSVALFGSDKREGSRTVGVLRGGAVKKGEEFKVKLEKTGKGSRSRKSRRISGRNSVSRFPAKNFTDEVGECLFNVTDQVSVCDWTLTSQSSIKWSFGLGETAFMTGGPSTDSNGSLDGGHAFIDTSAGLQGPSGEIQRASLESPKLPTTDASGRCFTFWYNIGGLSADRLRVILVSETEFSDPNFATRVPSFTVLWERKDSTGGRWLKGEILYTFARPHRLIFEGFARSGNDPRRKFQGFIAVDDFVIDSDSCKGFCTFEGILCDWEDDDDDDFNWQMGRGSLSHLTGPVRDHGDGPEGGYMVIESSFPRRPGDVARLTSPDLPPTDSGPICLKFWTHMYGNGIGALKVLLKPDDGDRKLIWEVSGESGNSWHLALVTIYSDDEYQISLEGTVGKNSLGAIAIDDVSFGPGPCPSSPQSALPSRGDCTFEADECGWINAGSGDQYDFLRTSSGQPLLPGQGPNSGYRPPEPLSDHTTGLSSGFFLTMERSSIPPRSGEQAYIVGPTLSLGGSGGRKCFSFWFYMHERSTDASGPGLGSLRVFLRLGSSSVLRPIWRLINHEFPDWLFGQTPIDTHGEDTFQVVIGGTWGSTRQGAIALDDFTFYEGNCSVLPAEAKVSPGECTFDSNLCEWTSVPNATRERSSWQLATNVRRPSNLDDHTYRASFGYVFFDIFSQQPNIVRLESPELVFDENATLLASDEDDDPDDDDFDAVNGVQSLVESGFMRCLTFWVAPFGSSRNTFLRIIQRDVASNNETQLWEMTTGALGLGFRPEWTYGQVAIPTNLTHRIIFEGSSNNGGFALDDITFVPGECKPRPFGIH